jgi:hypothetical protein
MGEVKRLTRSKQFSLTIFANPVPECTTCALGIALGRKNESLNQWHDRIAFVSFELVQPQFGEEQIV